MKFTVNAVKSFRGHEGYGFNANLLADGKKVAFVIDEANGGCFHYEWIDGKGNWVRGIPEVEAELKKQALEYCGDAYEAEDVFVSKLVEDVLLMRTLTSKAKKAVLFVTNEITNEGAYYEAKTPTPAVHSAFILNKYKGKDCIILNPLIEKGDVEGIKKLLKIKTFKEYQAEMKRLTTG